MELVSYAQIIRKNRASKARYAVGIEVGDFIEMSLNLTPSRKYGSKGNYSLDVKISKFSVEANSFEHVATVSQNEIFHGFTEDVENTQAVFLIDPEIGKPKSLIKVVSEKIF